MSKYFSNDVLPQHDVFVEEETTTYSTPKHILQNDESTKSKLTKQNNLDKIEELKTIAKETYEVDDSIANIEANALEALKNIEGSLKKFSPAQLFERLNQITVLLIELNNRVGALENSLNNNNTQFNNTEHKKQTQHHADEISPKEKFIAEESNELDYSKAADVKKAMEDITSQNKSKPALPDEDYIDKGVNLEEIFPDRPTEAFQAAYEAMANEDKMNMPKDSTTQIGTKRGIVF